MKLLTQKLYFLYKSIAFVFLVLLYSTNIYAASVEDIAKKAHLANINALLIFTSQDSLNTGLYHFTNVGVDMRIYNLPFSYNFNVENSSVDYFIVGNIGYSEVNIAENIDIPPNTNLDYESHLRTYTAGLGGGIRYKASKELDLSAGMEFIYSRSGVSVKELDDDLGDAIGDLFNKNYNDNMSYKIFAMLEYKPKMKNFKPYAKFSYKIYDTKSTFSLYELTKFSTQSSVTTFLIGAETEELFTYNTNYLTLEAYFDVNYLNGAIQKSVKFDSYTTTGAVAYWYVPHSLSLIERFYCEVSKSNANGLKGYNLGIGFSIDY